MDRQLCVQTPLQGDSLDPVLLLCGCVSGSVLWRSHWLYGGGDPQQCDGHLLLDPLHLQHPQTDDSQQYCSSSWCGARVYEVFKLSIHLYPLMDLHLYQSYIYTLDWRTLTWSTSWKRWSTSSINGSALHSSSKYKVWSLKHVFIIFLFKGCSFLYPYMIWKYWEQGKLKRVIPTDSLRHSVSDKRMPG